MGFILALNCVLWLFLLFFSVLHLYMAPLDTKCSESLVITPAGMSSTSLHPSKTPWHFLHSAIYVADFPPVPPRPSILRDHYQCIVLLVPNPPGLSALSIPANGLCLCLAANVAGQVERPLHPATTELDHCGETRNNPRARCEEAGIPCGSIGLSALNSICSILTFIWLSSALNTLIAQVKLGAGSLAIPLSTSNRHPIPKKHPPANRV